MCVQNLVPIGPQATTCIPSEGYTHRHTHTHTHSPRAVANGPVGPAMAGPIIEPVICFSLKKN